MNKNSLFTKAIAGFLAVLMVFGTLVSLRGFSVKAEPVVEDSAVRSEKPGEGTKSGSVDYRVVSDSPTTIYEIPYTVHKSVYYNTSNPYDYRQYEKYTVGWYDSGIRAYSDFTLFGGGKRREKPNSEIIYYAFILDLKPVLLESKLCLRYNIYVSGQADIPRLAADRAV